MKNLFLLAAAAMALLPAAALADPGHPGDNHPVETACGRPGDPAKGGRAIQVAMMETETGLAFAPARIAVTKGEQVQFVLRNQGELENKFGIGTVEEIRKHEAAMAERPDHGPR